MYPYIVGKPAGSLVTTAFHAAGEGNISVARVVSLLLSYAHYNALRPYAFSRVGRGETCP